MDCRSKLPRGIVHLVVQVAPRLHLKPWQRGDDSAIGLDHRCSNLLAFTMAGKKLKKRCIPQVLFEVSSMIQIFGIDFWYGQTVLAKMPREFEERDVLLAHIVQNSDGGDLPARQPYNFAPRAAELPLQRLHLLHRHPEVLLEQTV